MFKVLFIIFVLFSNNLSANVGDICHAQEGGYYGGVIEEYNGREICNFWKFWNLEEMTEEDRYFIEDNILNIGTSDDSEYDFSEDLIIENE